MVQNISNTAMLMFGSAEEAPPTRNAARREACPPNDLPEKRHR